MLCASVVKLFIGKSTTKTLRIHGDTEKSEIRTPPLARIEVVAYFAVFLGVSAFFRETSQSTKHISHKHSEAQRNTKSNKTLAAVVAIGRKHVR
jgi:hypothetical protein